LNGFLFDENLPHRLTFSPSRPLVSYRILGKRPLDTQLWNHARDHSLVIVTKDADFSDRIMITAAPPWIVHLRFGNLRRKEYHSLLAKMWPRVEALLPDHKLICVYRDRIESFRD
jgi:predicted nuclease of predicted toxin-antitoxin system